MKYNIKNCSCGGKPITMGIQRKNKYGFVTIQCKECKKYAGGKINPPSDIKETVEEWNNFVADMSPSIFWDMAMADAKDKLSNIYSF